MWNLALNGLGEPKLPGTDSCGTPCRPIVTVNSNGTYNYNQECAWHPALLFVYNF